MKSWFLLVWLACGIQAAEDTSYWVQPCSEQLAKESGCESADEELARWALEAWQKASDGSLRFSLVENEANARIRIYWAPGSMHLYGEARPILVGGKPGAAIYVRPDLAQLGPDIEGVGRQDKLFRDSIVYLTCLHESGHALGLPHTRQFADIMYSFQFGGDIVEYFSRYRREIGARKQIREHSGMSDADRKRLLLLLGQ
jgi:hypothetical protein